MAITRNDVRDVVERLVGVYSQLRRNDVMRDEIGQALMRHAEKVDVADLYAGCTLLIESVSGRSVDGGPATPPGPHEVVGCVLTAKRERMRDAPPIRYSMAQSTRDKVRQGLPVTSQEANAHDVWEPGITFSQWWSSLTISEQHDHATLREYMAKDADLIPVNA